ncbi:hypothetical protein ACVWWK_008001 [Bradyrhizobium sp. LB9.1b]
MPRRAVQPRQDNIGDDGTHAKRLALKTDIESVTDEAAASIGADEVTHPHRLLTDRA